MSTMRRGAWVAAAMLAAGLAQAQTASPPDPLAPGAAAEPAKPEKTQAPVAEKAAKPEPEKKHERAKAAHGAPAALTVTVHNERSVGLMLLSVVPAGDPDHKKVLGALAFGRKAVIHIKRAKDCLYDIRGHFADEADTEQLGVELCKDKAINLTD